MTSAHAVNSGQVPALLPTQPHQLQVRPLLCVGPCSGPASLSSRFVCSLSSQWRQAGCKQCVSCGIQ